MHPKTRIGLHSKGSGGPCPHLAVPIFAQNPKVWESKLLKKEIAKN